MFGAPLYIIEDIEGDIVVIIVLNCHLLLGYTILWALIALSKDTSGNAELKIYQ